MLQSWNSLRPTRPPLPPARLTADVYETTGGEAYVVEVPVPGLPPDAIVIEATSDGLTVSTRPKREERESGVTYLQREQPVHAMSRVFEFPVDIDTDNIRATLQHGIVTIHVPKAAAGRRKVIEVARSA